MSGVLSIRYSGDLMEHIILRDLSRLATSVAEYGLNNCDKFNTAGDHFFISKVCLAHESLLVALSAMSEVVSFCEDH